MMQSRYRTSWFAEALARAVVASGVGYLLASYTVSRWLTRPSRGKPRLTPAALNLPFEAVECRTDDGHRLAGWVISPPKPCGTVAVFHGIRHNRAQVLSRIAVLADAGYRCVAFDHRAHGQSTGRCSSFGYFEARDVEAVVAYSRERWPGDFLAAVGVSMGAAALCFASARISGVRACCLESLYHDVASAFQQRIGTKFPAWFGRFVKGAVWVTERRLGLKLAQVTPADYIGGFATVPILLMTGEHDLHAPPADARRLLARCTGPAELAVIDGADHGNLCTHGSDVYRQKLIGFLERHR
jgi:uncharacterized protein